MNGWRVFWYHPVNGGGITTLAHGLTVEEAHLFRDEYDAQLADDGTDGYVYVDGGDQ